MSHTDKLFRTALRRSQENIMGQNGVLTTMFHVSDNNYETIDINIVFLLKTQSTFNMESGQYIREAAIEVYNQDGSLNRFMSFNSNGDFDCTMRYRGAIYKVTLNRPLEYLTQQIGGTMVFQEIILI